MSVLCTPGNLVSAQRIPNSIIIHDNQYACYNSTEYFIIDSTISVYGYSEEGDMYDSGYTDEVYLDTTLSKTQMNTLDYFIEREGSLEKGLETYKAINK